MRTYFGLPSAPDSFPSRLAVIGAGPVGLCLALMAARKLSDTSITLFDARSVDRDIAGDPRTLALSLGSIHLLEQIDAWPAAQAQAITEVQISQQPPSWAGFGGDTALSIRAAEEGVPMLGAVLSYGQITAPLQAAWLALAEREPARLQTRFGIPVAALKSQAGGVEVDAGIVERYDLAVVAEGGVFAEQARKSLVHDYRQTAWVGRVEFAGNDHGQGDDRSGVAVERFTRHGPVALLPLKRNAEGPRRAALVWCVPQDDDPVAALDDAQRVAVLNTIFPRTVGKLASITPLKAFPLGLNAERTLVDRSGDGTARIVRIGNAAQTLHPVAGQGLNLGLRDAYELVRSLGLSPGIDAALRRVEMRRAPDRWSTIATTDFLARSFTWRLPGAGAARGLGLAALGKLAPAKAALAKQMMFGWR